jgi:hypothetical protein
MTKKNKLTVRGHAPTVSTGATVAPAPGRLHVEVEHWLLTMARKCREAATMDEDAARAHLLPVAGHLRDLFHWTVSGRPPKPKDETVGAERQALLDAGHTLDEVVRMSGVSRPAVLKSLRRTRRQ